MTTKEDIRKWFREAKKNKATTHLLIVCDEFEWTDYPVEIYEGEDIQKNIERYSKNMQKVVEVYNMKMDMEEQLSQNRVWNIEKKSNKTRKNIIKTFRKK